MENVSINIEVLKVMGVVVKVFKGVYNNLYVLKRLLILIRICYLKEIIDIVDFFF